MPKLVEFPTSPIKNTNGNAQIEKNDPNDTYNEFLE